MLQWSRMALAQTAAGRTMLLTNTAVSLVARQSPVAAERVRTSRLTRITARMWPAHSVLAKLSPGANTSIRPGLVAGTALLVDGADAIERRGGVAQRGDDVMQGRLVGFDLGDQVNPACSGLLEGFF